MRQARFQVSGDLLRQVLHMPEGALFVAASVDPTTNADVVTFVVDDPELPEAGQPHDCCPSVTHERPEPNGLYPLVTGEAEPRIVWHWNVEAAPEPWVGQVVGTAR